MNRQNTAKQFKGYWWLPDNPDDKVAGVLTYYQGESCVLELIGCFEKYSGSPQNFFTDRDNTEELIYGIDSDAKEISLIHNYRSGSLNLSSEFPITRYSIQYFVYDRHILGFDVCEDYIATVRIPELSLWMQPQCITQTISFTDKKISNICLSFYTQDGNENNRATIICKNGLKISFRQGVKYNGGYRGLKPELEQYSYLIISTKKGISLKELYHEIYKLERFFSLATQKEIVHSSIVLNHPNEYQVYGDDEKVYTTIQLYDLFSCSEEDSIERTQGNAFLFDFDDVKDELNVIMSSWMDDTDNMIPIKSHLVDSIIPKRRYGSVDFLIVIQAIEGFWWRFRDKEYKTQKNLSEKKNTSLNTILSELTQEFDKIAGTFCNDWEIKSACDSRHYFSHFVEKDKKPEMKDGYELYLLTCKYRKLLVYCVLLNLGLSVERITKIIRKIK